ncbi:MAG: serine hydrolase [Myxococcota bacterium]
MSSLLALPPQPENTPWPTEDWPTAELDPRVEAAALEAQLDHAFSDPEPDDLERTHGVVVVHRGALVAERYAHDVAVDDAFRSWSMAKSITMALVGILVRDGKLDVHAPIPVKEWDATDPRRAITIDQMLRMVDGLRFREAESLPNGGVKYYPDEENDVVQMLFGPGRDDVAGYASTLPRVAEPEARWNYNSGASNLLARVVSETVGGGEEGMRAFMARELFGPLGMRTADPVFDAAGTFVGSAYCPCSPRDFARFGLLFLRDGIWDGERLLPEGWADYARTPSAVSQGLYGAHFWTIPGSLGTFECHGAFGQRVTIVPKLDLVVVRLGNTSPAKVGHVVAFNKAIVHLFRPTAD